MEESEGCTELLSEVYMEDFQAPLEACMEAAAFTEDFRVCMEDFQAPLVVSMEDFQVVSAASLGKVSSPPPRVSLVACLEAVCFQAIQIGPFRLK